MKTKYKLLISVLSFFIVIFILVALSAFQVIGIHKHNYPIDFTNEQLQHEINQLFNDSSEKIVLYPTYGELEIYSGKKSTIAFGINNNFNSSLNKMDFSSELISVKNSCGLTIEQMDSFILTGKIQNFTIPFSESSVGRVNFQIPKDIPDCEILYNLKVKKGEEQYTSKSLEVIVKA